MEQVLRHLYYASPDERRALLRDLCASMGHTYGLRQRELHRFLVDPASAMPGSARRGVLLTVIGVASTIGVDRGELIEGLAETAAGLEARFEADRSGLLRDRRTGELVRASTARLETLIELRERARLDRWWDEALAAPVPDRLPEEARLWWGGEAPKEA